MATVRLSEETALEALKGVKYPGFSRDIVSFGFVKDLSTGGGNVSFRLALTADAPAVADEIRAECEAALRRLPGVTSVTIAVQSAPPARPSWPPEACPRRRFCRARVSRSPWRPERGASGSRRWPRTSLSRWRRPGTRRTPRPRHLRAVAADDDGDLDAPFVNEEEKILPIVKHGVRVIRSGS